MQAMYNNFFYPTLPISHSRSFNVNQYYLITITIIFQCYLPYSIHYSLTIMVIQPMCSRQINMKFAIDVMKTRINQRSKIKPKQFRGEIQATGSFKDYRRDAVSIKDRFLSHESEQYRIRLRLKAGCQSIVRYRSLRSLYRSFLSRPTPSGMSMSRFLIDFTSHSSIVARIVVTTPLPLRLPLKRFNQFGLFFFLRQ